jgi:probable F420-dependent oxidoreductase
VTAGRPAAGTAAEALPRLSVSLGLWQDRPAAEALTTALAAEEAGYPELWIGEMATYDAFALGAVVACRTGRIGLTLGPLAAAVRDPVMIAMGVASVAELTGRRVDVAIGTSSPTVVEAWHGRRQGRPARALAESATALRTLLDGGRADLDGTEVRTHGFRLRAAAPKSQLTVAAFGPAAVRVAAGHADRMAVNLVTPEAAGRLASAVAAAAAGMGRPAPPVAAWVVAAVDPDRDARERVRRSLVGYLAAPGYAQMFTDAGFGDLVELARGRPHPRDLLAAVPGELVDRVAAVGDAAHVRRRLAAYRAAGVAEVALVPCAGEADPGGVATLRALAPG